VKLQLQLYFFINIIYKMINEIENNFPFQNLEPEIYEQLKLKRKIYEEYKNCNNLTKLLNHEKYYSLQFCLDDYIIDETNKNKIIAFDNKNNIQLKLETKLK